MNNILEAVSGKIEVKVKKGFDPKKYFKDRDGLLVWSSFIERIVDKAEKTTKAETFSLDSFKLLKTSTDEVIEKELPEKHVFSETEVCAIVATLIENQPKGEEGILDSSNYNWNLFYTPTFVVGVRWGSSGGFWSVYAFRRHGGWDDGGRVFSPASETK